MSTEHNCIYLASLYDYNAGILHGVWIDFDTCLNVGEVWEAIRAMLAASPTAKREREYPPKNGLSMIMRDSGGLR